MLRNYFKTAFRSLWRHRFFTGINMLGLTVGMVACLLILQYVRYEYDYDKTSPNTPALWRVYNETVTNGQVTMQDGNTHSIVGPSLKADQPEVKDYFRLYNRNAGEVVFFQNNQPVTVRHAWMTDPGFLRIFPQRFLAGNPATCLTEPWKMVITETAARQLFPNANAVGQMLRVPGGPFSGEYMVEGIVADPPQNTHLKFNVLASYATRYAKGHQDGWGSYWDYNYFQLVPGANPNKVRERLNAYSGQHLKGQGIRLNMQPFESIHLHSNLTYEIEPNGSAQTVRFLGLVAVAILAIAFVNYINMTTARSAERAKEVGMRKLVGASKLQVVLQFLLEGLMLNGMAMLLAVAGVRALLPWFGGLVGRPLATQGLDGLFWMQTGCLFLACMLAACSYPALVLAKFGPLSAMRGPFVFARPTVAAKSPKKRGLFINIARANNGSWLRKTLVVFQFACSATLIIGVMVVSRQLNFLQQHDKGLSLEQIVSIKIPDTDWRQDSLNQIKLANYKTKIGQASGISAITASGIVPGLGIQSIAGTSGGLVLASKPSQLLPGTNYYIPAEPNFYETFGISFKAGKPYVAANNDIGNRHVIINEAMLQLLGFASAEAAIGAELAHAGSTDGYRMKIEGVVANFNIESLKEPARPTLYFCQPTVNNGFISIKLNTSQAKPLLATLEDAWKKYYPENAFDYWFLNEQFAQQYIAETQLQKVFGLFAALAIFIACLGLFGLAKFTAGQRTKEVGIRKVLGASVASIASLLSKDFLKLVLVAFAIAAPLSWWAMHNWLQDYTYRISISWWVFAVAGTILVLVAILTIGYQAVQAALANPVKSLNPNP